MINEITNIEKYRFRTSLGYVYLSFSPEDFKTKEWEACDESGNKTGKIVSEVVCYKFTFDAGENCISDLYDGCLEYVEKMEDGSLWAKIELSDGYYGAPEYLLEKYEN